MSAHRPRWPSDVSVWLPVGWTGLGGFTARLKSAVSLSDDPWGRFTARWKVDLVLEWVPHAHCPTAPIPLRVGQAGGQGVFSFFRKEYTNYNLMPAGRLFLQKEYTKYEIITIARTVRS